MTPFARVRTRSVSRVVAAVASLGAVAALAVPLASAQQREDQFWVSVSANRSDAVKLDGARLEEPAAVFYTSVTETVKTEFFVDDPQLLEKPINTEYFDPFDFAGTTPDQSAVLYDFSQLTTGPHSISVRLTDLEADDSIRERVTTATFYVRMDNPAWGPPTTAAPETTEPTTAPATPVPVTTAPATTVPVEVPTTTSVPETTTTTVPLIELPATTQPDYVRNGSPVVPVSIASQQLVRTSPNLLSSDTANVCSSAGWSLAGTVPALIDTTRSRSAGKCGSMSLPSAASCPLASTDLYAGQNSAQLNKKGDCPYSGEAPLYYTGSYAYGTMQIPVNPGAVGAKYTFSGYMLTDAEPRGTVDVIVKGYKDGVLVSNAAGGDLTDTNSANSLVGKWEEFVVPVNVPAGVTSVAFNFNRYAPDSSLANGTVSRIWIDDLYFGIGVSYEQAPTVKKAFNGSEVSVDSYGNLSRKMADGQKDDFFPMCIAQSGSRHGNTSDGFKFYSSHGWNCIWSTDARGSWKTYADLGIAATDPEFAPEGMCFQLDTNAAIRGVFSGVRDHFWSTNEPSTLQTTIRAINSQGYSDNMCGFIMDAENQTDKLSRVQSVVSMVRATDSENNGGVQRHPIISNVGSYGLQRWYKNSDGTSLYDVSGTYAGWYGGLQAQDMLEGQTAPGQICQISSGIGAAFRSRVYRCLANGSKGVSYWADNGGVNYGSGPVENEAWWSDSTNIAREIKAMNPLIRQPHWTSWKANFTTSTNGVASANDPAVTVGTRMLNGRGYIIVANESNATKTVTMNLSGLGYTPTMLKNYFDGSTIATFSGTTVTFTISPSGNSTSFGNGGGMVVAQIAG